MKPRCTSQRGFFFFNTFHMKRGLLLITCLFCLTGWGFAQERNHGIKIGIGNSIKGNLEPEVAYERAFSDSWSGQIGLRFFHKTYNDGPHSRFTISPEIRFYPFGKRMKGLFFSGTASFWLMNSKIDDNSFLNEGMKGELGLGYQFVLWNRITLDPYFRGGFGYTTYIRETSEQKLDSYREAKDFLTAGIRLGFTF